MNSSFIHRLARYAPGDMQHARQNCKKSHRHHRSTLPQEHSLPRQFYRHYVSYFLLCLRGIPTAVYNDRVQKGRAKLPVNLCKYRKRQKEDIFMFNLPLMLYVATYYSYLFVCLFWLEQTINLLMTLMFILRLLPRIKGGLLLQFHENAFMTVQCT